MIDLPYPNINGESNEKKLAQINAYLIQLKDALEFALMGMSSENQSVSEALAKGLSNSNVERQDQLTQVSSKMASEADSTKSAIEQTADRIMLEVAKKIGANEVVTIINVSPEEIELKGNRILIESDNFDLTKDGKVIAKGVELDGVFTNGSADSYQVGIGNAGISFINKGKLLANIHSYDFTNFFLTLKNNKGFVLYDADSTWEEKRVMMYNTDGGNYIMLFRPLYTYNTDVGGNLKVTGTTTLASSPVISSDKDAKNDISRLDLQKATDFVYSLKPCEFKYKNGTSNRFHHGLIAQEVKEAMGEDDWGVYICDEATERKGLRYEEIIADLIATVQTQNERIKALEEKIQGE